jgi:signal transduction histidine kinase
MPVNLQLPYDQNFIQFHFSSLNLARYDTTWYRYRMAGVDDKWTEVGNFASSRNYFGLGPGKYTFEVAGRGADSGWSAPAKFTFTINPPWWQTWWAYICYVILFTGSAWGFAHYRSYQLLREKRVLEHKILLRTDEILQQKEEIEAQRDHLAKTVNELKVTQSQLIQSEKLASLGELTAGIAHEIQNPLNFVNNFSEVSIELLEELKEAQADNKRQVGLEKELFDDLEQNLTKINFHGKRAESIVKNMLQHSRASRGGRQLTDINILADEYMHLAYHGLRAKDKNFTAVLKTSLDKNIPPIDAVPQDIGRVMLNIFNNAFYALAQKRKHDPDFQPIVSVVTLANENKYAEIKIRDNGDGIPEHIKGKIMQPFFTTKPTGEGTGLGLSLSYDIIVNGYGGRIDIDSVRDEFTEFVFTIPYS